MVYPSSVLVFACQLPLLLSVAIDVIVVWGFKGARLAPPCPTSRAGPFQRTPPSSAGAPGRPPQVESGGASAGAAPHQIGQHFPRPHGRKREKPTTRGGPEVGWEPAPPPAHAGGSKDPITPGGGTNYHDFRFQSPKERPSRVVAEAPPRARGNSLSPALPQHNGWFCPGLS